MKEKQIAGIIIGVFFVLFWYGLSGLFKSDIGLYVGLGSIYGYLLSRDLK